MSSDKKLLEKSRSLRKNMTYCERLLWNKINRCQLGVKFRRQYVIDNKYIVDFVCFEESLIIELDGGQHGDSRQDLIRDDYLSSCGFKVIRFWNKDLLENMDGCLQTIKMMLCRD